MNFTESVRLASPLPAEQGRALAVALGGLCAAEVYPASIANIERSLCFLARQGVERYLGVFPSDSSLVAKFTGAEAQASGNGKPPAVSLFPTSPANAAALREILPFLVARPLGLRKSAGCGDRLGLATPGHVRAVRRSGMAPIFAQQSMRENARTGRTPQQVMDDAMWGVFQEGWRDGYGADADHLKTAADIDVCAAACYTFYTIDPGEYVDNAASTDQPAALREKVDALPWDALEGSPADLLKGLGSRPIDLGGLKLAITHEELWRAAAKYGHAVAHTVAMYRHVESAVQGRPFELEMSVDETETVSTLAEHVYIAHELKRLGVKWVSLAPRYVGDFEKGADYIGDLAEFERSFTVHLAVAKTFGPYKLSLHSGSDKFSIYPIASRVAGELVHLKTAGTSYLEALRAVARLNPELFRAIAEFARERYPEDRASYHVSADLSKMPEAAALADRQLARLLDDFHAREVLHVTFGSVINSSRFRVPFFETLRSNEETYYQILEKHFERHLAPFGR